MATVDATAPAPGDNVLRQTVIIADADQRRMQALDRERLALQPKFQAQRLAELCNARSSTCIREDREEQTIGEKPLRPPFSPRG
jgi:hypothetical protein